MQIGRYKFTILNSRSKYLEDIYILSWHIYVELYIVKLYVPIENDVHNIFMSSIFLTQHSVP